MAGYLVFERDFGRAFEERGITFGVALAVEVFLVPGTFRSYSAFRFGMAFLFETLTSPLIPVTMALPTLQLTTNRPTLTTQLIPLLCLAFLFLLPA